MLCEKTIKDLSPGTPDFLLVAQMRMRYQTAVSLYFMMLGRSDTYRHFRREY